MNHIDTGFIFGFCLMKQDGVKVFLKIIQKSYDEFEQFQSSLYLYQQIIAAFIKIKETHDILPKVIYTRQQSHFNELNNYIFVLYEFVEGSHPINRKDIDTKKFARVFSELHHLPTNNFSFLPQEILVLNMLLA